MPAKMLSDFPPVDEVILLLLSKGAPSCVSMLLVRDGVLRDFDSIGKASDDACVGLLDCIDDVECRGAFEVFDEDKGVDEDLAPKKEAGLMFSKEDD